MADGTAVERVLVEHLVLPLEHPMRTATFEIPNIHTVLVRLHARDGLVGCGWAFGLNELQASMLARIAEAITGEIVGCDSDRGDAALARLRARAAFAGDRGAFICVTSAFDAALWDIKAKRLGQPVYALFGPVREELACYASEGLWLDRDDDALVAEAVELKDRGFTAMKMRVGLADWRADVRRVGLVREAVGRETVLMADANRAWNFAQARVMANELAPSEIYWLEEPMPAERIEEYAALRAASPVGICTGEWYFGVSELAPLVRARGADYIMPDFMRVGGVSELIKISNACDLEGIQVSPHLFAEFATHVVASLPNVQFVEHMPWWDIIQTNPLRPVDGRLSLTDRGPGFGIEIDEAAVRSFRVNGSSTS
jgi:L-alanine-DL-glutamate epimerase-like enolase superfamily enzyme